MEVIKTLQDGTKIWDECPCGMCAVARARMGFKSPEETVIDSANRSKVTVTGFNCKLCNSRNDYAEANQKDGSYVCFNCR